MLPADPTVVNCWRMSSCLGFRHGEQKAPSLPAPSLPTKPARVRDTTTAVEVARGPGAPLPLDVQRDAALRFGHSFSHVRIHADANASAAAKTLHAAAFTLGGHIVFGANRYAPESLQGQLLLQHELRHVSEQRSAAAVAEPDLDAPHPMHERDAHSLDSQVEPVSVQRIQCAPEDAEFSLGGGVVDSVGKSAFGDSAWPFIKAVFEGFVGGLRADVKSGRADQAKGHLSKLFIPWNAVKFYGGYLLGLVLGLISPITDLVKGIIGVVKLGISALEWLAKWSPVGVAISPERQQKVATLMQKFADLSTEFGKALSDFVSDPKGTVKKFAGFLDNLMQLALGKARELGTKAAHSMFDFLEKEFFDMGQGIGEVIGALIAQILLLVFSDAIGNLISKGASFLGKAAEFVAGKAVELFEWVKGFASEVVTLLHDAVKGALKLFEGLVNKAVEAFDALAALFTESEGLEAAAKQTTAVTRQVVPPDVEQAVERGIVEESRVTRRPVRRPRPAPPTTRGTAAAARGRFDSLRDGYARRLAVRTGDVHHAIELQVLDRYPGAFTEAELNTFQNMRGIPEEIGGAKQLHNSKIREIIDRHYRNLDGEIARSGLAPGTPAYNNLVRSSLLESRSEIDYVLGQFFSEQRARVFP